MLCISRLLRFKVALLSHAICWHKTQPISTLTCTCVHETRTHSRTRIHAQQQQQRCLYVLESLLIFFFFLILVCRVLRRRRLIKRFSRKSNNLLLWTSLLKWLFVYLSKTNGWNAELLFLLLRCHLCALFSYSLLHLPANHCSIAQVCLFGFPPLLFRFFSSSQRCNCLCVSPSSDYLWFVLSLVSVVVAVALICVGAFITRWSTIQPPPLFFLCVYMCACVLFKFSFHFRFLWGKIIPQRREPSNLAGVSNEEKSATVAFDCAFCDLLMFCLFVRAIPHDFKCAHKFTTFSGNSLLFNSSVVYMGNRYFNTQQAHGLWLYHGVDGYHHLHIFQSTNLFDTFSFFSNNNNNNNNKSGRLKLWNCCMDIPPNPHQPHSHLGCAWRVVHIARHTAPLDHPNSLRTLASSFRALPLPSLPSFHSLHSPPFAPFASSNLFCFCLFLPFISLNLYFYLYAYLFILSFFFGEAGKGGDNWGLGRGLFTSSHLHFSLFFSFPFNDYVCVCALSMPIKIKIKMIWGNFFFEKREIYLKIPYL